MRAGVILLGLIAGIVVNAQASTLESKLQPDSGLLQAQLRSGGYLGVRLRDIDPDRAKALNLGEPRGVEVIRVEPGSPAEIAGIKAGDVLLNYNGENILGAQQLGRLVAETPQGRKIKIQLWRNGKVQTVAVTVGAPPPIGMEVPPELAHLANETMPDAFLIEVPAPILTWRSPILGIECEPVSDQLAQYFGVKGGLLVRRVDRNSPADKAGVKAGDVVTGIGKRSVVNSRDFMSFLRIEHEPGKPVPIVIVRERKQLTVTVIPPDGQN